MAKLAMNLWTLAKGTKQCDRELMVSGNFYGEEYIFSIYGMNKLY